MNFMEKVEVIEENVVHSFNRVKADIIRLQDEFMQLRETQVRLLTKLARIESKKDKPIKPVNVVKVVKAKKPVKVKKVKKAKKIKKPVSTRRSVGKTYIASKDGKKFHMPNCPFAQNIKPKTKVKFKTKTKPLNLGYKPCSCVK